MATLPNKFNYDFEIIEQAAANWSMRAAEREQKLDSLRNKRYDEVESEERLAKRVNRRLEKVKEALPTEQAQEVLSPRLRDLINRDAPLLAGDIDNITYERVMGETRDFLSIKFFEKGAWASRTVGRIVTEFDNGQTGYGTGFLVSPHLLLTNHHVLESEDFARISLVEFDYQLDRFGKAVTAERFKLAPNKFFLNDKKLDFALVAVDSESETGKLLQEYGFSPLIKTQGKIAVGECVNIIQHPRGRMKQIVIRENKLVDIDMPAELGHLAHYMGDTEPGSSGSPAFNDEWEVIALHHSSVPKRREGHYVDIDGEIWEKGDDPARLAWEANEGIRISYIIDFIQKADLNDQEIKLINELLRPGNGSTPGREIALVEAGKPSGAVSPVTKITKQGETSMKANEKDFPISIFSGTVTGPVSITINVGAQSGASPNSASFEAGKLLPDTTSVNADLPAEDFQEAIKPDKNYDERPGYDPDFLGFTVPLPTLGADIGKDAYKNSGKPYELKYYNFSVIMNKKRDLAIVAAVNSDFEAEFKHKRQGNDRWFVDPRLPAEFQTDDALYAANPYDRGHLVRRADAAWGSTPEEAKRANDDTFHFTNCSPQHEVFNQSTKADKRGVLLWGSIEEHIAKEGQAKGKLVVFNGPVFRADDPPYREVQIPREFWKVVVFESDAGEPRALAFKLSQDDLIKEVPEEEFRVGAYRPYQVRVRELERLLDLDFKGLHKYDPLEADGADERFFESEVPAVKILNPENIVFGEPAGTNSPEA